LPKLQQQAPRKVESIAASQIDTSHWTKPQDYM
jgi:hypothetical protein